MPDRRPGTSNRDPQDAGSGYFGALEQARCVLLTTFEPDGAAVAAPVRGVADGDRAFLWAWSGSGSARRLQHDRAVQVTPCSARGFFTYGSPLDATARLLPPAQARQATGKLARKHPVRHRFLIPLFRWARRQQIAVYELLADDAAGGHQRPGGLPPPGRRRGREAAGQDSPEVTRIRCVQVPATDHGISSIACIWATTVPGRRQPPLVILR